MAALVLYILYISLTCFPAQSNNLPRVSLLVEVVVSLVESQDISFLPLDVRAVLLELVGHVVTAALGQTQVLLRVRDQCPL